MKDSTGKTQLLLNLSATLLTAKLNHMKFSESAHCKKLHVTEFICCQQL